MGTNLGRAVSVVVEILVNFIAPLVIFVIASPRVGDVHALIVSAVPPLLWSIFEFVRRRRIDAISLVVLLGIGLSLLAFLGGGGVRALQLRDKLVTSLIGLIFLTSAAIGRPLIYYLARAFMIRSSQSQAAHFVSMRDAPFFRRAMMVMTLAWGSALVVEGALAAMLTFVLQVEQFLLVAPVLTYGTVGLMMLWSFWYGNRHLGTAMKKAMKAEADASRSDTG